MMMIKDLKIAIQNQLNEKDKEYRNLLDSLSNGRRSDHSSALENNGYRDGLRWVLHRMDKNPGSKIYHVSWRQKDFVSKFGGKWEGGDYVFGVTKFHAIAEYIETHMEHINDIDDYEFQAKLHKEYR